MFIISTAVLIVVVFIRKRREHFLILTPLFFSISAGAGIVYFTYFIYVDETGWPLVLSYLICFFFMVMGHWMFSVQYLKTSLILSKIFIVAKLEWVLDDENNSSKTDQMRNSMDLNRLQDELAKANRLSESSIGTRQTLLETFKNIDTVIKN